MNCCSAAYLSPVFLICSSERKELMHDEWQNEIYSSVQIHTSSTSGTLMRKAWSGSQCNTYAITYRHPSWPSTILLLPVLSFIPSKKTKFSLVTCSDSSHCVVIHEMCT